MLVHQWKILVHCMWLIHGITLLTLSLLIYVIIQDQWIWPPFKMQCKADWVSINQSRASIEKNRRPSREFQNSSAHMMPMLLWLICFVECRDIDSLLNGCAREMVVVIHAKNTSMCPSIYMIKLSFDPGSLLFVDLLILSYPQSQWYMNQNKDLVPEMTVFWYKMTRERERESWLCILLISTKPIPINQSINQSVEIMHACACGSTELARYSFYKVNIP